jgi:hypothetical protein
MPLAHKPSNLSGGIAAFLICSTLRCPLIFTMIAISINKNTRQPLIDNSSFNNFDYGEILTKIYRSIINKTFCKIKPPPPLQGQALRVLQKIFSLVIIWLFHCVKLFFVKNLVNSATAPLFGCIRLS